MHAARPIARDHGEPVLSRELPAVTLHVGAQVDGLLRGAKDGLAGSAAGAMARSAILIVPHFAGVAQGIIDRVGEGPAARTHRQRNCQRDQLKAESHDSAAFLHDNPPAVMEARAHSLAARVSARAGVQRSRGSEEPPQLAPAPTGTCLIVRSARRYRAKRMGSIDQAMRNYARAGGMHSANRAQCTPPPPHPRSARTPTPPLTVRR